MENKKIKRAVVIFAVTFLAAIVLLIGSFFVNNAYNRTYHEQHFGSAELFPSEEEQEKDISVEASPRSDTWTKIFDFDNEGITDSNYQAYIYDFTVSNNTNDEVTDFSFVLYFGQEIYLSSAWNGALEIHQIRGGVETVDTVPDLRVYNSEDYDLEYVTVDGEAFVVMEEGDYFKYIPSSSANAMEVPIRAGEGTTPGFIIYAEIGRELDTMTLDIEYKLSRALTAEPLFWIALALIALWILALVVYIIIESQIRKYNARHERDNIIINESIETFTGFIDAKDPYTNGHSNRVAKYTRLIAEKMGFEGEELDRIYYVALLHDCGKIGVPDNILGKPGKLTDEEFEIIKSHTVRGGEILSHFKSLENAGEGALYHHERYD